MARLKYYRDEQQEFKEVYAAKLTWREAKIVYKKLCRHFRLPRWCGIEFTNRINGGKAKNSMNIMLRFDTDCGIMSHEVAHLIEFRKYGKSPHRKRHHRIMARVIQYCIKKNYWTTELAERLAPKPMVMIDPLQERQKLIAHKEQMIVHYQKRLAYFTKLYSHKITRTRASIRMLSRKLEKPPEITTSGESFK